MRWAVEAVANPSVLRLHTTEELTDRTIVTCPPALPPAPLDLLLALPGVRTLNLHRYRCRVNLRPGADAIASAHATETTLLPVWGAPEPLPREEDPRAFAIRREGPRIVAESREMAGTDLIAQVMFDVPGVVEVVLGPGLALVRLGRLFRWTAVQVDVVRALTLATESTVISSRPPVPPAAWRSTP